MLSTAYRLKLEDICTRIANLQSVTLEERIWCEKLARANRTAATILRQARRKAENPEMRDGGLDDFLNRMDLGNLGEEREGISGFDTPDDVLRFFHDEKSEDWRTRD